ncbi:hypothetical protein IWQ60_004404 [Tieghemiomyces parasiticus]|uniref:Uncharacterized protein n=1 Tax=Tieghemiomyces parasiticus TaxID=78921 RepID=A0A9W8DVK0_9FUNG|nr:hypothetical protein IWQ60_004404 [Tieghemiomyces parasiticus]
MLIQMLLGPNVLEGLAHWCVEDWEILVKYLQAIYSTDYWGNHYIDLLTKGSPFQGMGIGDASILVIDVTWYLGAAFLWAVQVVDTFLTKNRTSHDLAKFMDHIVKEAKLSKKHQEYVCKYVAPGPSCQASTINMSTTALSSPKVTPPKPDMCQHMYDQALKAEAKPLVQEKADVAKVRNV